VQTLAEIIAYTERALHQRTLQTYSWPSNTFQLYHTWPTTWGHAC